MNESVRKIERNTRIQWVPVAQLRVDLRAQRSLRAGWVDKRVPTFDINGLGFICVNRRADGNFYVIDGQHRVELLKRIGWGDQKIEAEVFFNLPLKEEAEEFLRRNDRLSMATFDLFRARLTAEEPVAVAINTIVNSTGLRIDQSSRPGAVSAIKALEAVYAGAGTGGRADGPRALSGALSLLRDAWGKDTTSFEGNLIRGTGMVIARYDGVFSNGAMVRKLSSFEAGAPGVKGAAAGYRRIRSQPLATCVANVLVDLYNKGRRSHLLEGF